MSDLKQRARLIAFYLPQFHPISENDEWWGKGFTEWTNVAKAKQMFRGHYQPHIPADLGFYDLRLPETREAQAEMAKEHGIEGFCYWHYWFAGKRLIERPFNEVLKSKKPDFPFCVGWANQSWTGIWHGEPGKILMEQTYPGLSDYEAHFSSLLDAFADDRYITIEGKPVLVVFNPYGIPEPRRFTDYWRELSIKSGLKGMYIIGNAVTSWVPEKNCFDASFLDNPTCIFSRLEYHSQGFVNRVYKKLTNKDLRFKQFYRKVLSMPTTYSYKDINKYALFSISQKFDQYPCIIPNWDNTPRSKVNGVVLQDSTQELFRVQLRDAIRQVSNKDPEKRVIFIKSWNEWAEGNYLEPDQRFGTGYLKVIRDEVSNIL